MKFMCSCMVIFLISLSSLAGAEEVKMLKISPKESNSSIDRFIAPNYIFYKDLHEGQDVLIYLPGTNERPEGAMPFLEVAADAGYRVISLSYNNFPSVDQACHLNTDRDCAEKVRRRRAFGENNTTNIDDTYNESIVQRISSLMHFLSNEYPNQNWQAYMRDGDVNWPRVTIAGHSQGGGMAALIAKSKPMARVVILSGGWDEAYFDGIRSVVKADDNFAPWLSSPSVTPMQRWYAAYHVNEFMHLRIAGTYDQMNIPPEHIYKINNFAPHGVNFHNSVVKNSDNESIWRNMIGVSK